MTIMTSKGDFFNRKVGGFGLALVIIIAYVSFKFSLLGTIDGHFAWYVVWFVGIVFSALTTDLFVNNKSWVETAMTNVERTDVSKAQRFAIIKQQLEIAVDRYMSVFLIVNGFDSTFKRVRISVSKIFKGAITTKELLLIVVYALWDLVIRNGLSNLENPFDIVVLFLGLTILKIIDAKSGFANLVAEMYKEIEEGKDQEVTLTLWANYIKQLANLYDLKYVGQRSPEEQFEGALTVLNDVVPKLTPESITTIKAKIYPNK